MAPNGDDAAPAPPDAAAHDAGVAEGTLFRALAHPVRLQTLRALAAGPRAYTDLRRRVGGIADTPSTSRGKFNYHLDALERARLVEQREDAYVLTHLGRSALQLADAGRHAAPHAAPPPAALDVLPRALRGGLAAIPAGATMMALVLLAEAATIPAGARPPPLRLLLPWGLAMSLAAFLAVALTPIPPASVAPTRWTRLARNAASALLVALITATPYAVYESLRLQRPFSDHGATPWLVALAISLGWLALLDLGHAARLLRDRKAEPDPNENPAPSRE